MTAALIALAAYGILATIAVLVLWSAYQTNQNRLFQAWKDGFVIAPLDGDVSRETLPHHSDDPLEDAVDLPPAVIDYVAQFEGRDAQIRWLNRARTLMRKHPGDIPSVLMELDEPGWVSGTPA